MRTVAEMPYHIGLVIRIYPSYRHNTIIAKNDGSERAVYNRLVALNNESYRLHKVGRYLKPVADRLEYVDSILNNDEQSLRACLVNAMPFLDDPDIDSMVVDNGIKNYRSAWKHFREVPGSGVPTFHKKDYVKSYNTNAHYKKDATNINDGNVHFIDEHHITLPKIGKIRFSGSPEMVKRVINKDQTRIGEIRIYTDAFGRTFAALQIASETSFVDMRRETGKVCAFDLNIDDLLAFDDGTMVKNPKYRSSLQQEIAKVQRRMARKALQAKKQGRNLRDCKNYQRDRQKYAQLLYLVAARAKELRHQISSNTVKNHDAVFAEDLLVANMLKNHHLARAISECGWSDLLQMIDQKSDMYDKVFIKVRPNGTSQTCSACGYVLKGDQTLTLLDREMACPHCGMLLHRDTNSARVILQRGMAEYRKSYPGRQPSGQGYMSPPKRPLTLLTAL